MMTRRRLTTILATLLFSMLAVGGMFAQDEPGGPPAPDTVQTDVQNVPNAPPPENAPDQGAVDPPGRVARIQFMAGEVSMQPGGVNDWVAATQNRPLTTSDRVWTDKDSKAELSTGDAFLRMNSETSVTLSNVSDNTVQVELDQGTLELTVRHLDGGEIYEIDTPNAAFTVTKAGVYRFDVFPNEDKTWITVRKGSGQATGKGNAVKINSGQQVRFSNDLSLVHTAEAAPANDGFDDWAKVRDERLEHSESARYVSPGVIGAQDLDQYGRWQTTPQYGAIWVPNSVPAGWAPYRNGHWAWIDPWGWTWVDDAPWGFAPFHYGRWVSYGGYWGWAPGPIGYWRPYYAPALVGWIGGPGFGIGFGGAGWGVGINFGWFALGFGEPFYPWYGGWGWGHGGWYRAGWRGGYCSPGYFRNVNVTNIHVTNVNHFSNNYYSNNINNTHFVNRNVNGAVTAAPKSAFTSGAAINRAGMAVPRSELNNARMVRTANVAPTRESVLGGHAPLTRGTPPASAFNRSVVTHNTPPQRPATFGAASSTPAAGMHPPSPNGNMNNGRDSVTGPGANTAARNADTNLGGHNVPRPPSAGGTPTAVNGQANAQGHNNIAYPHTNGDASRGSASPNATTHNVPRPPTAAGTPNAANESGSAQGHSNIAYPRNGDSEARGNAATTNHDANATNRSGVVPNSTVTERNVPRPPSNYSYQQQNHAAAESQVTHNPSYPSQQSHPAASEQHTVGQTTHAAPPPQHQSAPAVHESSPAPHQSAPAHDNNNKSDGHSKSDQPRASGGVPRPPTGYSYHAAPTYTASAAYGANRSGSSYGGSSYGRSASPYSSGSSYGRSASSYGGGSAYPSASARSSYPTSSYGASRSYSPAPSYSGRTATSYGSAPRSYAGSSGGAHYSSGGGAGHYSSGGGGGGGHASGGGHSR